MRRPGVRFGYVPQVDAVDWSFPVTVDDVVAMAIPRRWPRMGDDDRGRVASVLERLGIGELGSRHIRALSGGQQQRVFVARALVASPDVLVLDEPAGGVDVAARHELLHLLADLHHDGTTIVLTTHDINGLAAHLPRLDLLQPHGRSPTGRPARCSTRTCSSAPTALRWTCCSTAACRSCSSATATRRTHLSHGVPAGRRAGPDSLDRP